MELTSQQLQAIDSGQPVPIDVEGRNCVLVPEPVYEQLVGVFEDWDPKTMKRQFAQMMREDWAEPSEFEDLQPDSNVAWSTSELAKALGRLSRPDVHEEEPLGFDPDDYPLY